MSTETHDLQEEAMIPGILEQYPLDTPCRCSLLGTGAKSRAYLIEPPAAETAARVLKLYAEGWRTRRQIEAELSLMSLLDQRGVRVVLPCARRDGSFVTDFPGRSSARHAVMMTRAAGEVVPRLTPEQAWHVGRALAGFHLATRGLEDAPEIQARAPGMTWRASHLNLGNPVSRIATLFESDDRHAASGEILEGLHALLLDLRGLDVRLRDLASRLEIGLCHGSFHFGNFSLDGDAVTFFDLEAQGLAYQVMDISILLCDIAQNIHNLRKQGLGEDAPLLRERTSEAGRSGLALLEGYESERRLGEAERGCLLAHAPVSLAIHIGVLIQPGTPLSPQSEARIATFLEQYASWNRLRRDLGWDGLDH
jgi:Ser/Thr protein kinase RdoA (MazF antagonist)